MLSFFSHLYGREVYQLLGLTMHLENSLSHLTDRPMNPPPKVYRDQD